MKNESIWLTKISFLCVLLAVFPFYTHGEQEEYDPNVLKKYEKKMIGPRWGYEANKDWDRLVELAKDRKTKSNKAFDIIFTAQIPLGLKSALYMQDLYKIFNEDPVGFIRQGRRHFDNKNQCLHYWLIPESQAIPFSEFEISMKKALKQTAGKQDEEAMKKFYSQAKKFLKVVTKAGGDPSVLKCHFFALKHKENTNPVFLPEKNKKRKN